MAAATLDLATAIPRQVTATTTVAATDIPMPITLVDTIHHTDTGDGERRASLKRFANVC